MSYYIIETVDINRLISCYIGYVGNVTDIGKDSENYVQIPGWSSEFTFEQMPLGKVLLLVK